MVAVRSRALWDREGLPTTGSIVSRQCVTRAGDGGTDAKAETPIQIVRATFRASGICSSGFHFLDRRVIELSCVSNAEGSQVLELSRKSLLIIYLTRFME